MLRVGGVGGVVLAIFAECRVPHVVEHLTGGAFCGKLQLLNLLGCKVCIGQRGTVVALIPFVSLVTFGARLSLIAAFTFLARGAGVTFLSLFTLERRKLLRREVVESEWVAFLSALALFALLSRLSRVALDVRKHGLDFNVGGIIPASRHKLDVKRLRRVKVTHTVRKQRVGKHEVRFPFQHSGA